MTLVIGSGAARKSYTLATGSNANKKQQARDARDLKIMLGLPLN